jgi:hypothetical protein
MRTGQGATAFTALHGLNRGFHSCPGPGDDQDVCHIGDGRSRGLNERTLSQYNRLLDMNVRPNLQSFRPLGPEAWKPQPRMRGTNRNL